MAENVLYLVGRAIIPKRVRPDLRLYLLKAGKPDVPYTLFGSLFFIVSVVAYFLYMGFFYTELKTTYSFAVFGVLTFIVFAITMFLLIFTCFVGLYFHWNIKIYNRTKELELLLPDYLTLVSTNLKGGMSFESALWSAIKPEFGILANEIGLVSKRVMTGNEVAEALVEFSVKYESPTLRRNVQLLIGELESGGKIVDTIDKIVGDMKKTESLKKEMAASTVTYMMFIGALVAMICPVLFALSLELFSITTSFIGNISGNVGSNSAGLSLNPATITKGDFRLFSLGAITIISVFSSIIIAIIEKGEVRAGLKYIPMLLISSLTVYFIATGVFGMLFGNIQIG
ncbi:MAG: type II secretion system F family protein [Candidatus Woesearchaeota archaeon]|nr:type II secretion system F family protein [Candidatus Woesearchaeota archaeon]